MKKATLFLTQAFLFTSFIPTTAQIIKFDNGVSISSIRNNKSDQILPDSHVGYTSSIGVEYLEHKYFSISTELGYIQKGGRIASDIYSGDEYPIANKLDIRLDYIQLNTTFRIRFPMSKFSTYSGVGPKIDIPVSSNSNLGFDAFNGTSLDFRKEKLKTSLGLLLEVGCAYDLKKFRIDLNVSHLIDFGKIYENKANSLLDMNVSNKVFLINFGIGYFIW